MNWRRPLFSPNTVTPCVACIGVAPTGEVFAGVDQIGSLGKGAGKGRIVRLIDEDNDGVHDSYTIFAIIDNPRGIVPIGDKLLYCIPNGEASPSSKACFCPFSKTRIGMGWRTVHPKFGQRNQHPEIQSGPRSRPHHQRYSYGNRRLDIYSGGRLWVCRCRRNGRN